MKKLFSYFLPISLLALLVISSCKKDVLNTDNDAKLSFSTDTLLFDTVFTKLGGGPNPRSVNKRFVVRNPYNKKIKTNIYLAGGNASPFRINIDGVATTAMNDIEIMAKDSIYVFAEVTIDPLNSNNPLIVKDSIVFMTNGNMQDIKLVAWGQDAYYFSDSVLDCNTSWNNTDKPYVIYNSVLVPENCKLTIGPGVKIFSDVGSVIYVAGTLEVNGNKSNRVSMKGARLGAAFDKVPGQWQGIHFLTTSKDSKINYADIYNAVIGVRVDSASLNANKKCTVKNSIVRNMSAVGILGYTASIEAENCEITNCGKYNFAADLGGDIKVNHCTVGNDGIAFSRKDPAFILSNADYKDEQNNVFINPLKFSVTNNIIWGDQKDEIEIFTGGQGAVTANLEVNILKTSVTTFPSSNLENINPRFKDITQQDFSLGDGSPAIDAATGSTLLIDLKGESRTGVPDIGAYEKP